jgi:class I lanthipeptide synthase
MAKSTTPAAWYQSMDFTMVRAPLLPVEAFLSLRTGEDQHRMLKDPRVLRAVAVGSMSLLNALQRLAQSGLTKRDEQRLMAKLLRYQIRMSTRPTPYGLFAGCAVVPFGDITNVTVQATFGRSRTRPDMRWLMNFVVGAEANPEIRRKLRLRANPLIHFEGGRISLAARMPGEKPGNKGGKSQPVSARATPVTMKALELARNGLTYDEVSAGLLERSPTATRERADRFLDDLLEQTFLLTDLRPPLTTDGPAEYVLNRLREIPEASQERETLEKFLETAARWDTAAHDESLQYFRLLLQAVDCPEDGSQELPCQVDMALAVEGQVGTIIAKDAARAAELLLRLSPSPGGLSTLAAYRNAFVSRYGHEREVPVTELLDPVRGLGPVSAHGHGSTGPDQARAAKRARTLQSLAGSALHSRLRVLEIDERLLGELETSTFNADNLPVSLDINLMVAAQSAESIDEGKFLAVVGPNLGAWAACRHFGRFSHLHPPDAGIEPLKRCAAMEQAARPEDCLWAEVVYLPANTRSANVAVRPAVRAHEVLFGVAPGVDESGVIALDDLVAGVADGRFYVRSRKAGKKVRCVAGHMLNHHGAPAAAQFLLDVANDGVTTFSSFDWGPAEWFPFLPRVQAGRIVLRPAEWKLGKGSPTSVDANGICKWREDWDVPRYVCLTFGDNRLILDLDCADHVQQMVDELAKLGEGQSLLLQEVIPALDDAWLKGEELRYYSELIVPLVLKPVQRHSSYGREPVLAAAQLTNHHAAGNNRASSAPVDVERPGPASSVHRFRPPGSDWLFAKLYCPARCEDELIAERMLPMAENAIASGLAESWFFIRYSDPERHIRLRFQGKPDRLATQLFGQVCKWAGEAIEDEICTRLVFDTYDREIERFGGEEGMAVAEAIFHADSRAAAALVKVLRTKQWEDPGMRTALFARSVDELCGVCGFSEAELVEWYESQAPNTDRDAGAEYRKLKAPLRGALGDREKWLSEIPFGEAIAQALMNRSRDLAVPSARLVELASEGRLSQPVAKLAGSFVHLMLNRIGAAASEKTLLNLLFRTRDSLMKAPFRQEAALK